MVLFDEAQQLIRISNKKTEESGNMSSTELLFILEGKVSVTAQDQTYLLKEEDVLVLNINDKYAISANKDAFFARINLPGKILLSMSDDLFVIFYCNSVEDMNERYQKLRLVLRRLLMSYWMNSQKQIDRNVSEYGFISNYYRLLEVLTAHFRITDEDEMMNRCRYDKRMLQITSYIQKNYANPLTLQSLSEHLYLSEGYLSRYFKKNFGMNFTNYLKKVRMDQVMDELLHTDHPITQIIYENGFSGAAFFYKEFKKQFGKSPSEIREELQELKSSADPSSESEDNQPTGVDTKRLERFLSQQVMEDPDANVIRKTTDVQNDSGKSLHFAWKKLLSFGAAASLMDGELRAHLRYLKETLDFEYVRIWNLFSEAMLIDFNAQEGHYNFHKIDSVLDYILELGLIPFLDFEEKTRRINSNQLETIMMVESQAELRDLNQWDRLMKAFILHCIRRYGRETVSKWKIEVWYGGCMIHGYSEKDSFFMLFRSTYQIAKRFLPEIEVGGCGIYPDFLRENYSSTFWKDWVKHAMLPDFVTIMSYDYDLSDELIANQEENTIGRDVMNERISRRKGFGRKSMDDSFLYHHILRLKEKLMAAGISGKKIYVTEWNKSVSDRCFLNDSCYQSAYMVKNLIEVCETVDMIGYYNSSDLQTEFFDSDQLLHGGTGILSKSGIMKPAAFAIYFMNRLHPNLLSKNDNCIVTTDQNDNYTLVCCHPVPLSQYYYATDADKLEKENLWKCYVDRRKMIQKIIIHNVRSGNYQIKVKRINEKNGSILDKWKELDFQTNLSRADIQYLKNECQPALQIMERNITGKKEEQNLEVEIEMEPNEIALVRIYYLE